ncbi:MAG: hypothetical protein K6L80_12185 [Agarilytica sp.]
MARRRHQPTTGTLAERKRRPQQLKKAEEDGLANDLHLLSGTPRLKTGMATPKNLTVAPGAN